MKNIIFVFSILLFSTLVNAQGMRPRDMGPLKKIEELEKIKLIEALGMDESTTLKFFARRTKFREEQTLLFQDASKILNQMEETAKKTNDKNDPEIKKLVEQYFNVEDKILKHRESFIYSLNDILTPQQTVEYLVFEKKFRDEIRNVLFKERMRNRNPR